MAIKMNSVKCPECGANLQIEEGRKQLFCSYCGTKIIMTNENEYIYRHIDEAEMAQAETNRIVEMKRMEMAEKSRLQKQSIKKIKIIISIILGIIMLISFAIHETQMMTLGMICALALMMMWMGEIGNNSDDDDIYDGKIKVPSGIDGFEKKSYHAIEELLKSAGFSNIQSIPLNDLTTGLLKKPDMVESITINGKNITGGGKKFLPDATVVITYHSYNRG